MAREKEGYRDNLELLNLRFPNHDLLTFEEVMQVTGYTDRRSIRKYFGSQIINNRLSKVYLARYMCGS
jgi:hypothetical protein